LPLLLVPGSIRPNCANGCELRQTMQPAPIMLIQAANDYSIAPSYSLVDELERLHKPHLLKIYPRVGQTSGDGHNFLYLAIPQWEHDVFGFLDEYVKH